MKDFYRDDGRRSYTEDALRCDNEVRAALRPIFDRWIEEGYSHREIALDAAVKTAKEKNNEQVG